MSQLLPCWLTDRLGVQAKGLRPDKAPFVTRVAQIALWMNHSCILTFDNLIFLQYAAAILVGVVIRTEMGWAEPPSSLSVDKPWVGCADLYTLWCLLTTDSVSDGRYLGQRSCLHGNYYSCLARQESLLPVVLWAEFAQCCKVGRSLRESWCCTVYPALPCRVCSHD